jgi:hypothetical protein
MAEQTADQTADQAAPITPFEFLQGFAGAPNQADIDSLKAQAPGGRIRLFHSTDAKRVYLMRGISAIELVQVQNLIPAGIHPDKLSGVMQTTVAIKCCAWTSETADHKLSDLALQAAGAGLTGTLHEIVCQLSDYMDPATIDRCSADL